MKKNYLFGLLFVFFLTFISYDNLNAIVEAKAMFRSKMLASSDSMSELSKSTLVEINEKIYIDDEDITEDAKKRVENDLIVLSVKNNLHGGELSSYYQKDKTGNYYKHIKNIDKSDKSIDEYYFDYDKNKCESSFDLIGGNCTNNYRINKEVNYNIKKNIDKISKRYSKNATKLCHEFEEIDFVKKGSIYYVNNYVKIDRYKNMQIKRIQKYNNKIINNSQNYKSVLNEYSDRKLRGKNTVDNIEFEYEVISKFTVRKKFNLYGKLKVKQIISEQPYNSSCGETCDYTKYFEKITYYKNKNIKKIKIFNGNRSGYAKSRVKRLYRVNGKKYTTKKRVYKKRIVRFQYFYHFNKNGELKSKASRTKVTYNSEGKPIEVRFAKYNRKGKLRKSKLLNVKRKYTKW